MTGINIDTIAPAGGNAWKLDVGEKMMGTIVYAGTFTRLSDYSNCEESVLRIDLDTGDGDPVNVYATMCTDTATDEHGNTKGYAKRDARAIAAAVRAAGEKELKIGGILAIKRIADVPTKKGEAKAFVAEYKAPAAAPVAVEEANDGAVTGLID